MNRKIIVATDNNGLIGQGNQMPWHLPADFAYFKEKTTGSVVIMGSNTFFSLGKPLPNRKNIIISSRDLKIDGVEIFKSLEEALDFYPNCFIIGGAKIYKYAMDNNLVDEIYLTKIDYSFGEGDAYFYFNEKEWKEYSSIFREKDEKNKYEHKYLILKKAL